MFIKKSLLFVSLFFVFVTASFAAELPHLPFIPATCASASADAYKKVMNITNKTIEAERNKQFFQFSPELKKLFDRSGLKLRAQPPTVAEVEKAAETAKKSDDICAAEAAVQQKKLDEKKKGLEGQIKALQTNLQKLGPALPAGCTSAIGFSPTTGQKCSVVETKEVKK